LNGQWRFALNGPAEAFHQSGFDDSKWASIKVPTNGRKRLDDQDCGKIRPPANTETKRKAKRKVCPLNFPKNVLDILDFVWDTYGCLW